MENGMRNALLNDFAIRSFRDVADHDYIAARLAYRHALTDQFLWSGQQAIEKYLKAILLFNRIEARKVKHDLAAALELLEKKGKFKIQLSDNSRKFLTHLDNYGRYRYFETSPYVRGEHIHMLDLLVWELRRYCTPIDYTINVSGKEVNMLEIELNRIEVSDKGKPHKFSIFGGELERILKDRRHVARSALVYKNFRFGAISRKRVTMRATVMSKNSPLLLHPEILDDVARYVYLPASVLQAYAPLRDEALKRMRAATNESDQKEPHASKK